MYNLSALYHPITANPAGGGEYLPGRLLQPYIRCYWGSGAQPPPQRTETIIPDSCMDIIWEWDERTGESSGIFCGINDTPFETGQAAQPVPVQRFAIRFHFWGRSSVRRRAADGGAECACSGGVLFSDLP